VNRMVNDEALDILFREAHTHNKWRDEPVKPQLLMAVYDVMRWGPTSANSSPLRIYFVVSKEAKERLKPYLMPGNVEKTMTAPATAIFAYDQKFYERIPQLNPPMAGMKDMLASNAAMAEGTARRNATLQAGYFILAARALGLDAGGMSGFDNAGVDKEFFPDGTLKSDFLCNLGYGDASGVRPRNPRLSFDEACKIL